MQARYKALSSFLSGHAMAFRNLTGLLVAVALSGCAGHPGWSLQLFPKPKAGPVAGHYSFAWRLSGDRQVGPIQVFDDGKATWVHFASDQAIPAIFARTINGDIPLSYEMEGAYAVLSGVWTALTFRNGNLQALAERHPEESGGAAPIAVAEPPAGAGIEAVAVPSSPVLALALATRPATAAPTGPLAVKVPEQASLAADEAGFVSAAQKARPWLPETNAVAQALAVPGLTFAASEGVPDAGQEFAGPDVPASRFETVSTAAEISHFRVSRDDKNMRLALARWAGIAGWTFLPEHWAVEVDIPIVGEAGFDAGFEDAVQELLGATEMAERPLQPCFYSNRVLRIVPYAQVCDRTAAQEPV